MTKSTVLHDKNLAETMDTQDISQYNKGNLQQAQKKKRIHVSFMSQRISEKGMNTEIGSKVERNII